MRPEKQASRISINLSPGSFLDLLSGLFSAGTVLVGLLSAVIFINPQSRLNPLPPIQLPERMVSAAPSATPRPGLPPTWTPAISPTNSPTETPPPTGVPTSAVVIPPTPTAGLEPGNPPEGQDGLPASEIDLARINNQCSLQGFEGQAYDSGDTLAADQPATGSGETQDLSNMTAPMPTQQSMASHLPADQGISDLFTPEIQYWEDEILAWGKEYGLDPNLIATVMQIESCGYTRAKSAAGALGLFQVMPQHFKKKENPYDPETNAYRGLSWLQRTISSGGSIRMALAGYNAGIARVKMSSLEWPSETQRYVDWGEGIYQAATCGYPYSEALENWLSRGGSALCSRAAAEQQDQ